MRQTCLIIAVSALLLAPAAQAQSQGEARPPQAPASDLLEVQGQDDPNALLAERLVRLSLRGLDKLTQETINRELGEMAGQMPEEQTRWFRRNAASILESHMGLMIDSITTEYAARFTEAELNALIAFYETPMGRDIARKQLELGGAMGEAMQRFQIAYLTELGTKFCAEFDCEGAAPKGTSTAKPNRR